MSGKPQSFESHAAMVTGYHYVATALLMVPTLYFLWLTATDFSVERLALFAFAAGVNVVGFYARVFPLGVQDRVIRLEESLRMERLFPDDLRARIGELTTDQLIGLRFASDGELAELTRRVLDEGISDRKTIKAAITTWRPDHERI